MSGYPPIDEENEASEEQGSADVTRTLPLSEDKWGEKVITETSIHQDNNGRDKPQESSSSSKVPAPLSSSEKEQMGLSVMSGGWGEVVGTATNGAACEMRDQSRVGNMVGCAGNDWRNDWNSERNDWGACWKSGWEDWGSSSYWGSARPSDSNDWEGSWEERGGDWQSRHAAKRIIATSSKRIRKIGKSETEKVEAKRKTRAIMCFTARTYHLAKSGIFGG